MSNLFLIKKKKIEFLVLGFIFLIVSFLISQRSESLPDYINYKLLYESPSDIEFSYKFISEFSKWIGGADGFYILLFIYALIGFLVKNLYFFLKFNKYYYFLYILGYFLVFFPIWDLIQIRYSAGITFLVLGFFSFKKKFLFLFLSIIFHFSMAIPVFIYLFFYYIRSILLRLIFSPLVLFISYYFSVGGVYGEKYDINTYGEKYSIFTTNSVFSVLLILFIYFFRSGVNGKYFREIESIVLTSLVLLVFLSLISFHIPSASFRFLFLVNYLLFLCIFFIRVKNYEYILTLVSTFFIVNYVYQIFFSVHKTF